MPFRTTKIVAYALPKRNPKFGLPPVLTDFDLACLLGIKPRTLWWMLMCREKLYKVYFIPKSSGGKRMIHAPDIRLKRVQKNLYARFLRPIPFGPHVAAYVPGRGVLQTPPEHIEKGLIIHLDIRDFFNTTRQGPVKDMFRDHLGYADRVASMLAGMCTVPHNFGNRRMTIVPQGSPASGALCNAVVDWKVDQPAMKMLNTEYSEDGWTYSRYSDNVFLSTDVDVSREHADEVAAKVKRFYKQAGYRINNKKTRFQRPGRPQRVLGVSVARHMNIPSEVYRRLRAIIHNTRVFGPESQFKRAKCRDVDHLFAQLEGKLRYWSQVNAERVAPLKEELEEAVLASAAGVYRDVEVFPVNVSKNAAEESK